MKKGLKYFMLWTKNNKCCPYKKRRQYRIRKTVVFVICQNAGPEKAPCLPPAGLPAKGFALLIQIIYFTFANIKSNNIEWDFLTGLHKK
jgi:hypothetical protein